MSEMKSLTLNDKTYDCFVDGVARASVVVCSASGESITVSDSSDQPLVGLNIYGKSTQAGTPTPDTPVDIKSIGDGGDVGINVGNDRFVLMTGDGLHGIKVTDKSIATCTDANGQMWCADEINLARGVHIHRVQRITFDQINYITRNNQPAGSGIYRFNMPPDERNPSVNMRFKSLNFGMSNALRYNTEVLGNNTTDNCISVYNQGGIYARCDSITTAEEFLATARANNWEVLALLETPIETPLTAEQIAAYKALHTNKPNTTITNGENSYMTVKYIADAKAYIDNKTSSIIQATVE